jgi:hypothetical protein
MNPQHGFKGKGFIAGLCLKVSLPNAVNIYQAVKNT